MNDLLQKLVLERAGSDGELRSFDAFAMEIVLITTAELPVQILAMRYWSLLSTGRRRCISAINRCAALARSNIDDYDDEAAMQNPLFRELQLGLPMISQVISLNLKIGLTVLVMG